MKRLSHFAVAILMALGCFAGSAFAGTYPEKAITMVVPYNAGGSTDIAARIVASSMEEVLKQPIIIKNVSGAAGLVGLNEVLKATPDGYTIGYTSLGPFVFQPHMRNQPQQIDKAEFIGQDVDSPYIVFVSKSLPWQTFEEMVADLKANPNKYRYGSSGAGTQEHIALGDLFAKIGVKVQHVPFPSDAEKVQSMTAGHTHISVGPMSVITQYDMRPLLVLDKQRVSYAPDVPTSLEKGYDSVHTHWHVLYVPKGTPQECIDLLTETLKNLTASPDYTQKLNKLGLDPAYLSPEETREKALAELDRFGIIIREVILKK